MSGLMSVEVRDGTTVCFKVVGDGPARVALTHSLALDHQFWSPVVDRIAQNASVLVWDCRGHGASDKPSGPYTCETFADDLADIFDAIGWNDACVAGASMGGCVSLAFAGRHREKTTGLGLFDTTAWYGATAPQDWQGRGAKARETGLNSLVEFQKTRWFGDAFRQAQPEILQECIDVFLANDIDAYVETCNMLGNADMRDVSAGIDVPTRILVGEEDYATPPSMAQALHDAITGSSLTVIDGGRHLTPLEYPDEVAAELHSLLKELSA